MKSRGRSAGLPAAAAIVSMLLIVGWLLAREPSPLQRCSLPDGSVLTLEAVTYGRQHRFVGGPWWRRLLTPLLPAPLKGIIAGTPPAEYHSDSETIVFWVSRSGQVRAPAGRSRAVIFDEEGHELDVGVPTGPAWPGGEVRSFISAVFPRRTKRVGLRFYHSAGQGAPAAVGEFLVANPAHGPFPVWNVEPLPTVRRDGDLSITLSALTTGLRDRGPVRAPWSRGQARVKHRLTIKPPFRGAGQAAVMERLIEGGTMVSPKGARQSRSDSPLGVRRKVRAVSRKTKAKLTKAAPKLEQVQATATAMAENVQQVLQTLLAEMQRLKNEIAKHAMMAQERETSGNDVGDDGMQIEQVSKNLALKEHLERLLNQIESAVRRIEKGVYGLCERCGTAINPERLQVLPYATTCLTCARAAA